MTGYFYLATQYSKHPQGVNAAWQEACRVAASLLRQGVIVFSPIAHSHGIAHCGAIDPLDHDIWIPADKPFMDAARGLIVYRDEGWKNSKGIAIEIEEFKKAGKPVYYLDPGINPIELLDQLKGVPRKKTIKLSPDRVDAIDDGGLS